MQLMNGYAVTDSWIAAIAHKSSGRAKAYGSRRAIGSLCKGMKQPIHATQVNRAFEMTKIVGEKNPEKSVIRECQGLNKSMRGEGFAKFGFLSFEVGEYRLKFLFGRMDRSERE